MPLGLFDPPSRAVSSLAFSWLMLFLGSIVTVNTKDVTELWLRTKGTPQTVSALFKGKVPELFQLIQIYGDIVNYRSWHEDINEQIHLMTGQLDR